MKCHQVVSVQWYAKAREEVLLKFTKILAKGRRV